MESKKVYDEVYKDIIRSVQEFEDDNISERYDSLYDNFLDYEDIILQYIAFDFSNERCFDKSALDRVAKHLLPKHCHELFPVFTKEDGGYLKNYISLLLTGEQFQLLTELQIKVIGEMVKNRSLYDDGDILKYEPENFEKDMLDSMTVETCSSFRRMYALANVVCCNIRSVYPESSSPLVKAENTVLILWSHTTDTDLENNWQPNHFVVLIPEQAIPVKTNETQPMQRKFNITNFFDKIPSSKSTEKKTEVTQVSLPKKTKSRKK